MEFKVLGSRVLAEKLANNNITTSGICLASSETNVRRAKVVCLPEDENVALDIRLGDKFIYEEHTAIDVKIQNKDYIIIDLQDILLILKEEKWKKSLKAQTHVKN